MMLEIVLALEDSTSSTGYLSPVGSGGIMNVIDVEKVHAQLEGSLATGNAAPARVRGNVESIVRDIVQGCTCFWYCCHDGLNGSKNFLDRAVF